MYELLIERRAEKELKKLDVETFRRIVGRIRPLAGEPRPSGCRKLAGSQSDYRIRVGAYRVLYEIDDQQRLVRILTVLHRREAYRNRS